MERQCVEEGLLSKPEINGTTSDCSDTASPPSMSNSCASICSCFQHLSGCLRLFWLWNCCEFKIVEDSSPAKFGIMEELGLSIVANLRGKNADISQEAAEIGIGVGLMLLQQFGGISALEYYASSIFEGAGVSSSTGSRGIDILQISANGMGFGSFFLGLSFCLKACNIQEYSGLLSSMHNASKQTSASLYPGGVFA
ncbi:hypothetical protein WN944_007427 [Citrus x changshan-huyou]|uniref:Uncharacterized protein n=1 Tax=Citrus x changshan-huyou TaxID=2935761 RepID=A0AAP0MNN5_9ROSI